MATIQIPDRLVERLRAAALVVALTGAGISAESGLPTFREKQTGLWARYRPDPWMRPAAATWIWAPARSPVR